jgi:hypothetical protein
LTHDSEETERTETISQRAGGTEIHNDHSRAHSAGESETVLAEIQALPSEARPTTSFPDPHQGWAEVSERLHEIIDKLKR